MQSCCLSRLAGLGGLKFVCWLLITATLFACHAPSFAADKPAAAYYRKHVQPILADYCFACHGDGLNKGGITLDEFKSDEALLQNRELWWKVLKNLRAGIMPPAKKPRPTEEQTRVLECWVKEAVFGINPNDPDPGRVTLRRLNRVEYRNTIRDLMGIDFKTEDEFPPDDTGYGFDTIADVLTLSPLLLEKYMQAAQTIVAAAVPRVARVVREETIAGKQFRGADENLTGDRMSFYQQAKVGHSLRVEQDGDYRLLLDLTVAGEFDFDPGRCNVIFKVDDRDELRQEFLWHNGKAFHFEIPIQWKAGEHRLVFELYPLVPPEKRRNSLNLRITSVRVQGPLDEKQWVRPKNFELFFTRDVPKQPAERQAYAREVLSRFTKRAFRRPCDERTVDRLVAIAESASRQPGKSFEDGIAQAFVAVLASPRFLFRVESSVPTRPDEAFSPVDEYALATRLSYFLWSTMPDDELMRLADRGELRKSLHAQVKRMLADPRSEALIQNFTGQWLQARDVEGIAINARVVLRREGINFSRLELDRELRQAMRRETELCFAHVMREDRSVVELIDSDYTFLNERLARHYGIADVTGPEMRKVTLPKDSSRGGILTHGSVLTITSNPTRTSPVKRGMFILDNILGTPTPPPPADVPDLAEAEKEFKDRQPTMRELMELHRSKPLCSSCHSRMDPLGLALENFNALGMYREKERGQAIDAGGKLITGEEFTGVRELKRILTTERRQDFYRCLTEKMLTYALGRGLDYYDVHTVDQIVAQLEREKGRFSVLLTGVIESAPFQKRRNLTPSPLPRGEKEK